jgi:predicted nucleic acid-binding protein
LNELKDPSAPAAVCGWATNPPEWLDFRSPRNPFTAEPLDAGESDAIAVALELRADVLLIDDLAGRKEAISQGLSVAGTLAVLDQADRQQLIDFERAVVLLQNTSFRLSDKVLSEIRRKRQF